ncbi:MAG: Hsp20/alpha crystallin family protein [Flavobacteriales bacterium]|nr:Hsp20/alpha crystallin family protein [Flavobacteriales bacterium]
MITKYRPTTTFASPFNDLFSGVMGHDIGQFLGYDDAAGSRPKVNIIEGKDKFVISMLVPGFDRSDLKISNEKEVLTIKGERSETSLNEHERYTRREFRSGSFERSFTLPSTVDLEAITAEYTAGVLNINIPRKEPAKPAVRSINID